MRNPIRAFTALLCGLWLSGAALAWSDSTATAAPSDKTIGEYWAETGLKFDLITETVTTAGCYATPAKFFGCVQALDVATAAILPGSSFVPPALARRGTPIRTFGPASIVRTHSTQEENETLTALATRLQNERRAALQAWSAYFRSSDPRLNFESIVRWIGENIPAGKESQITATIYNAFLKTAIDPHTSLAPRAYMDDESNRDSTRYVGLGIQFRILNRRVVIQQPYEGSPAHRAGVRSHDIITHIDDFPVSGLPTEEVSRRLRKARGQVTKLALLRRGQSLILSVTSEEIVRPNVVWSLLSSEDRSRMGYIKLSDFSRESSCDGVEEAVDRLTERRAQGIILDLRGNPGGRIQQALCIANSFLDRGDAVFSMVALPPSLQERSRGVAMYAARTRLPLVTLIDAYSASASELLAGALQDHQRGLIVGTRSFGKGTAQTVNPWERNSKINYLETNSYFLLPSGRSNQITGIVPDLRPVYRVPRPTEDDTFAMREEDLYFNALPPPGINTRFRQTRPELVSRTQACVDSRGLALTRFERSADAAIGPDYQLLVAQDTLQCSTEPRL